MAVTFLIAGCSYCKFVLAQVFGNFPTEIEKKKYCPDDGAICNVKEYLNCYYSY